MLDDETCWFLAIDFDKRTWEEDVRAVVDTARRMGLPAVVERSRSGNGAHVWFFFSAPVAATTARKMGCHLITETMSRRHELSMDSYDRLFPSQDTMPRGGFGNLIALPLQHGPRQEGNSVFLDDNLVAFPDEQQWAFLASVERIDPMTAERIASEASRTGSVVGLRLADADEDDAAPWARMPSGKPRAVRITGALPKRVSAVLTQRLFVEKAGLPSPLLNLIKRLAAFQNPEFYKKQSMRLSTAMAPRVVNCAQDLPQHVALPRGCRAEPAHVERRARRVATQRDDTWTIAAVGAVTHDDVSRSMPRSGSPDRRKGSRARYREEVAGTTVSDNFGPRTSRSMVHRDAAVVRSPGASRTTSDRRFGRNGTRGVAGLRCTG